SLAHCIDIVAPRHVIVADELIDALADAEPHLATRPRVWRHSQFADQDEELNSALPTRDPPTVGDRALCIYTSGTTGLPKAALVRHRRLPPGSWWFAGIMVTGRGDRLYNCLPMYHSIGGVVATGAVLVNGGSVAISETFSASRFWDDVV